MPPFATRFDFSSHDRSFVSLAGTEPAASKMHADHGNARAQASAGANALRVDESCGFVLCSWRERNERLRSFNSLGGTPSSHRSCNKMEVFPLRLAKYKNLKVTSNTFFAWTKGALMILGLLVQINLRIYPLIHCAANTWHLRIHTEPMKIFCHPKAYSPRARSSRALCRSLRASLRM